MTKISFALTVFLTLLLSGCFEQKENLSGIIISGSNKLYLNDTMTLNASAFYTNKTNESIQPEWFSSDVNIAEINSQGKISPKSIGNITISAIYKNYKTTFDLKIFDITNISINTSPSKELFFVGESANVNSIITFTDETTSTNSSIVYTLSDSNIAILTNNSIKAIKPGKFILTAFYDNYHAYTKEFEIVDINSINIINKISEMKVNEILDLQYNLSFTNNNIQSDKQPEIISSNSDIISVEGNKLTARSEGISKISVKLLNSIEVFDIKVFGLSNIITNLDNKPLYINESLDINPKLLWSNNSQESSNEISVESSDNSLAVINNNNLTILQPGTFKLSFTYRGFLISKIYSASNNVPVSISTDIPQEIFEGETFKYRVYLNYSNNSKVDITNQNPLISYDKYFLNIANNSLQGKNAGETNIFFSFQNINLTTKLKVKKPIPTLKSIILNAPTKINLLDAPPVVTAYSEYSDNTKTVETYSWSSSNPDILEIKNQVLIPKKSGSVILTAEKNGIKGQSELTVIGIDGLNIKMDKYNYEMSETASFGVIAKLSDGTESDISTIASITLNNNLVTYSNNKLTSNAPGVTILSASFRGFTTSAAITFSPLQTSKNLIEIYYYSLDPEDNIFYNIDNKGFSLTPKILTKGKFYPKWKYVSFNADFLEFYFSDPTGTHYKLNGNNYIINEPGIYKIYKRNAPVFYNVTKLEAPVNFKVEQTGSNSVFLTWQSLVISEDGYNLYRSNNLNGPFTKINTTTTPLNTVTDTTDIIPNTKYYYKISSFRGEGTSFEESGFSPIIEATTQNISKTRGVFKVVNSAGTNIGMEKVRDGFFYFTYESLVNTGTYAYICKPNSMVYKPSAMANFKINYSNRNDLEIVFYRKSPTQSANQITFSAIVQGGAHAYPDNEISIDISSLLTDGLNTICLKIINKNEGTNLSGSIQSFSIDILDSSTGDILSKYSAKTTPLNIINGELNEINIDAISYNSNTRIISRSIQPLDEFSRSLSITDLNKMPKNIIFPSNIDKSRILADKSISVVDLENSQSSKKFKSRASILPDKIDLSASNHFPPVGDQGDQNSCASWSAGYYIATFYNAKLKNLDLTGAKWEGNTVTEGFKDKILNPSFLYNIINQGADEGSSLWSNFDVLTTIGISSFKTNNYTEKDAFSWPNFAAWREAPYNKFVENMDPRYRFSVFSINTPDYIDYLKKLLNDGYLITISINSSKLNFANLNDVLTEDTYKDVVNTDHAITIVGYDNNFVIE